MQIWEDETVSSEWTEKILVFIYKGKGDPLVCSNHHDILLLRVPYKIFSIALNNRLVPYVDNRLGDYSGGFCSNESDYGSDFLT